MGVFLKVTLATAGTGLDSQERCRCSVLCYTNEMRRWPGRVRREDAATLRCREDDVGRRRGNQPDVSSSYTRRLQ